jgi:hypothetical protein
LSAPGPLVFRPARIPEPRTMDVALPPGPPVLRTARQRVALP